MTSKAVASPSHVEIQETIWVFLGLTQIHFKDDEFEVATATTLEKAKQVLTEGFDYITEKNGIMLFRRPKRFKV
jgi:hypothetical protein